MKLEWRATAAITLLLSCTSFFTPAYANPNPEGDSDSEDDAKPIEKLKPCQIRSPNTGYFFDLSSIRIVPPPDEEEEDKKSFYNKWGEQARNISWHARGYDYPANFTINFCGGVVEEMKNVVDVERGSWGNISAFYKMDDEVYSIGQQNDELVFRGRKLTLNYTGGSPCPDPPGPNDDQPTKRQSSPVRRKSTLISFLCERDPMALKASVAFVGTTDHCTYFFETRSFAACPAVNVEMQQVGPSGVFGLIFGIAIIVYVVGGVVYQRAVLHQRGWRQLPNYTLWASIATFTADLLMVIFSTCLQCCSRGPRKIGYGQMPNGTNGYATNSATTSRRARGPDDETRLMDQLDEEWDD